MKTRSSTLSLSLRLFLSVASFFGTATVALAQAPTDAMDLAIAGSNDHVYTWFADGTASSGTSHRLDRYRTPYPFTLAPGRASSEVRGIGIAGSDDHVYVWYSDGTASSGTSNDLDRYRKPYPYSLPPGKTPDQIVAMAIAGSDDHVYAWYSDGTASSGTSNDLDRYRKPYAYTLPPGRTPQDVIGIGIAGSDDHVYAWYRDGTASSGTSNDLDRYRAPYPYHQHLLLESWWGPGPRRWVPSEDKLSVDASRERFTAAAGRATSRLRRMDEPETGLSIGAVPEGLRSLEATAADQSPPPVGKPFEPKIQGVDPMVAVGKSYVLVSQQGGVLFLDRQGDELPEKNGIGPRVSANQLFSAFLQEGSPTDINQFVGFPSPCGGRPYPATLHGRAFCIAQAYDLRVWFDAVGERFLVVGQIRNPVWTDAFQESFEPGERCGYWRTPSNDVVPITWSNDRGNWCTLARRHVAIAISKTEDPRDGFHLYALTENNYRDFPWATMNGDSLVIANRFQSMPDGPVATVLSLSALRAGAQRVPYFRYYRSDLHGFHPRVLLPTHHGSPGGLTLMYATGNGAIRVFGFPAPARPYAKPPLVSVLVEVEPMFPAVYRDGFLYFAKQHNIEKSNGVLRRNILMARVPLWAKGSGAGAELKTSTSPSAGYLTRSFGKNGPGDDKDDVVSYEEPTLAVTKRGDMVFGYGRYPVSTAEPLFPEVRYTVWYHDEPEQRRSRVLKAGEAAHEETPSQYLDYAWAVVDPLDDATVWIAHEYAGPGGYSTVVGKVKP